VEANNGSSGQSLSDFTILELQNKIAALEAEVEKFTSTNNARGAIAFLQQAVDTRIDDEWLKKVRAFLKQATAPVA